MDLGNFSIELLSFLFLVGILAGFIDTLAGGGGLISIPALMMSGIPPIAALATNKFQGSMGTATATFMMLKNKKVKWHDVKHLMLSAFIGATIGTVIIQYIDTKILSFMIPVVILFIGIYFLISPTLDDTNNKPKISKRKYKNLVVPSIGCYDGLIGPGTGSFFALSGVSLRGHGMVDSTAIAKTLNFSTNIAALGVFVIAGHVIWIVGLSMMFGQMVGAWLGSHCLFNIPVKYLRYIVVTMCFCMLLKYVFTL